MNTAAEAIRALSMQMPGFRRQMNEGWYQIRIAGDDTAPEAVEALTGYLYEIQYSADGWQTSVGLIAQDAQKALPELVTEDADVISGEKRLRLNYNGIIALLVEGFKTLRHEIKELREK